MALVLAEARRRAVWKFGALAGALWADPQGVEMASSALAARYKAERCAGVGSGSPAFDLCCGIGGDAIALGRVLGLTCVDLDPVRAWMAGMNAGCRTLAADAGEVDVSGAVVHIDPARRDAAGVRRAYRLRDGVPPGSVVRRVLDRAMADGLGGVVKLGPGVDHEDVSRELPAGELEFVSEDGRLTQAILWVGERLAPRTSVTRATRLTSRGGEEVGEGGVGGGRLTIAAEPESAEHAPCAPGALRFVCEPDDSVERARLLPALCRELGAAMLHPRVGLLTSDVAIGSGWVRSFELIAEMPWNQRRVRAELERLGAGIVEVKTRGGVVDPDRVQGELRAGGERRLTVFVLRLDRALRAYITRRVEPG